MSSKGELDVCMEDRSRTSEREGNGCVSHRRFVKVKEFRVPAQDSVVPGEPIYAGAKVKRIAILAIQR